MIIITLCRLQTPEVCHRLSTSPPAGREVTACSRSQLEMLMNENKRLKQELEGHTEKALRIQKVNHMTLKFTFCEKKLKIRFLGKAQVKIQILMGQLSEFSNFSV